MRVLIHAPIHPLESSKVVLSDICNQYFQNLTSDNFSEKQWKVGSITFITFSRFPFTSNYDFTSKIPLLIDFEKNKAILSNPFGFLVWRQMVDNNCTFDNGIINIFSCDHQTMWHTNDHFLCNYGSTSARTNFFSVFLKPTFHLLSTHKVFWTIDSFLVSTCLKLEDGKKMIM